MTDARDEALVEQQTLIEAHSKALAGAQASLSTAPYNDRAAAEASAAREESLRLELAALRTLADDTTRELQEELVGLRLQGAEAVRSAVEWEARASEAVAAVAVEVAARTVDSIAQAAAVDQCDADADAIERLREEVLEAEERADAAAAMTVAAERAAKSAVETMERAVREARAEAFAEFDAAAAAAQREQEEAAKGEKRAESSSGAGSGNGGSSGLFVSVCNSSMQSLGRELDSVLVCVRGLVGREAAHPSATAIAAAAAGGSSGKVRLSSDRDGVVTVKTRRRKDGRRNATVVERRGGTMAMVEGVEGIEGMAVGDIGRVLAVAGRVSAHVNALREALDLAGGEVRPAVKRRPCCCGAYL